jgi:hypothetical protein
MLSCPNYYHAKQIVTPKILSRQQYWFLNPIFWQPQGLIFGVAPELWHKLDDHMQQTIQAKWENDSKVRALPQCPHANV